MLMRKLGSSGIDASVIGFGAWAIGGWMWGGADRDLAIHAIHTALDHGVTLIDTAPMYGFGQSEEIVGQALRDRRDQVILATKCGLIWDREKGEFHFHCNENNTTPEPSKYMIYKYLNPISIAREIEQSLQRLQTDHIDLYQTHWQDSTTPIEDTMATLIKLKEQGKIRAIGVSNVTVEHLQAYGPIDTAQEKFSMLERKIEHNGVLDHCRRQNIALLAYSPLSQGLLTGKITPQRSFSPGDQRLKNPLFSVENRQKINDMLHQCQPLADQHHATLAQLVTAWTFSQPGLTHVLCGARTPDQARENALAGTLQLSPDELKTIDNILQQHLTRQGREPNRVS